MKKLYVLTGIFLAFTSAVFGQLSVTPGVPAATLVSTLIGTGVTPSNITTPLGPASSRGTFTCGGACNVGYPNGIILTSGGASIAAAPNTGTGQGADFGGGGDAQLNTLTTGATLDASVLEFDFWVVSDSVRFNYMFASDEYSDYVGSQFNDVFGFFISGPGIVGQRNIALIPGTSTSVAINNVNNGYSPGVPSGPCNNCAYFHDNVSNAYTTAYDGITTSLPASSQVCPCETYHIKLAISDVGDHIFDSGVFLEGQSFSSVGQISIFANGIPQQNNATVYICPGQSVTLSVLDNLSCSVAYNWNGGLATTQNITVNTPGSYACTVTHPTNPSCFAFTTFIHVVAVTPTATITPLGSTTLCAGDSVTLQANPGVSYIWSNSATTQNITVNTAGTYTVTVYQNGNCSATSAPVQVTIGSPVATITGDTILCAGDNTILTANAGQSYLWSPGGGTTQTLTVSTAGTYSVTVTQAGGCTADVSATVTVNPLPAPSVTGVTSICQGATTTLDAGAGYTNYLWSSGPGTQTITTGTSGTYTVTVTDANGCSATASSTVTVNALPTPAITGTTSFCQGSSSILNAGGPYTTYLWSNAFTTQTITVTTAGNYGVTVTNGFGCTASTSINITVNALPVPNITGTTAFCQGTSTTLNAGGPYANYLWSNGFTTQTISVTNANIFTVTVTNVNGCTGSDNIATTVNPLPTPNITGGTSVCQGVTTIFDAGSGYSNYLWSTGPATQTITTGTAGLYTVTVTDANGCTGSDNINLTVNPLPTPAITGNTAFCQGVSSILNAGGPYTNYLWTNALTTQTITVTTAGNYGVTVTNGFGCTASTSVNITVHALPAPNITGITAFCQGTSTTLNAGAGYANYLWSNGLTTQTISVTGANSFTVTVTNVNGCTGSDNITTTVNPLPTPNITGVTSICQGATTVFDAGAGYSLYAWSTGPGAQTISVGTAGLYTVTVTDANGCTGSDNINLTVNPLPTPAITGNTTFCQGNSSVLNAGPGFNSYLWSTGFTTQTISVNTSGTYIVTVTNNFGCSANTNTVVTVNPLPNPVITGGTGICQGTSTILNAGNGYANYLWSTTATTQTISVSTAGNFTVTVTNNNGCSNSASTTMVINPLPTPVITGNTTVCQGVSTVFNAGAGYSAYSWSTGSGAQTISTNAAGLYTVTVTDGNGCTGSDNINLIVNPLPTPAITGNTTFCQGNSSVLNAGAGFNSYLWSTGLSTQTISVNTSGTYIVTVTNNFGCSANTNTVVTVNPLPNPVISGGTGICTGSSTTLNAGNGYVNYLWSTGATSPTIVVTNAGSYTVTVINSNGCSNSASTVMVVNPLPTPVITGTTAICQGTSTTFNAGAGYSSYAWSNNAGTQTISANTAGIYTVTVTDANGCTGSDNIGLVVNALPTPTISGNTVFCQGDNTTLNAGTGYTSYLWSNASTTQTINTGTAGNYSVIVEDGNGCTAATSVIVVVNPLPNPVITGANAICTGTTTILNAGNYASYVWSTGATTPTISTGASGNYVVTVTNNNGCVNSSAPFALSLYALPSATISQNSTICFGGSTSFTISFTGAPPFHYTYSNASGNVGPITTPNSSATINVSPLVTTNYTLVSISDAHCTGTISGPPSITVTVNPLPVPSITGNNIICDGTSSTFSTQIPYSGYSWSTGETTNSISINTAGTYAVTVTDQNGCVSSTSQTLIVNQTPVAAFSNDTSLTCAEPIIHFFDNSTYPAGSTFQWDFGDGSQSSEENPAHTFSNPGTFPISLTITSSQGCTGTITQNTDIQFYPLPVAEFKSDPAVASVFNSLLTLVDLSQNAVTWNWNFGDGGESNLQNPQHYYDDIGKFNILLTVTNIAGCVSRSEQEVLITPFYVPNAFTPNGDGLNDMFFTSGYVMDVASYNMTIWNRWGQKVYAADNVNKPWNGIDQNGNEAQQGTYVYQIKVVTQTAKKYSYEGTVTLMR